MQNQEVEQMVANMVVIIQPYQNYSLKAYNTSLYMFFISFMKDSNLQEIRVKIHTTSNAYHFYYNVKLIQTILKH